jgi:hypothetical protein
LQAVHVFVCSDRFSSFDEMRRFIDETYTEDGDGIDSQFMREVGLSKYEPGCIEVFHRPHAVTVAKLVGGVSYGDQWAHLLLGEILANAAICVFEPNRLATPERTSLTYLGALSFEVPNNDTW